MKSIIRDFGSYKNELIVALISSPDIVKLLLGDAYDPDMEPSDLMSLLVYQYIFPYLYIPDVQDTQKSYICVECRASMSGAIKNNEITIWAFCSKNKDYMKYSCPGYIGTRADILADMVDRQLYDSYDFGVGALDCKDVGIITPQESYYGRRIIYNVPDFKVKKV